MPRPRTYKTRAIVLGELRSKNPAVTKGLMGMLDSGMPPLQRHALDAFARIGMDKATDKAFKLLSARPGDLLRWQSV